MSRPPIFDHDGWSGRLDELARVYRDADPFPHVVLDDFLVPSSADAMARDFPSADEAAWIHYEHVNERKLGRRDRASFPPSLAAAIDVLNGPSFVAFLRHLTGIDGVLADPSLEGAGLHQSRRGDFLNIHTDFTIHPRRSTWRRRVNVLLYLNPGWAPEWGGELELWDQGLTRCVRRVTPVHNRVVVFETDRRSFHGHPDPLACPSWQTRKSIALYYFTADGAPRDARSTEYRPRPGDGARAYLIRAENIALRAYDRAKRRFGFDDAIVGRVLGAIGRLRRP